MHCDEQETLRRLATTILHRIEQLMERQIAAMDACDDERLMALDKEIELAFGEKERAFGALLHHRDQHGC